jgi:hypothetical protein
LSTKVLGLSEVMKERLSEVLHVKTVTNHSRF